MTTYNEIRNRLAAEQAFINQFSEQKSCAFCEQPASPSGLCNLHNREDQEIQRRNDANRPRGISKWSISDPEARHDW